MDKGAIKNYAVWARRKLIEDITQKAFEAGVTEGGTSDAVRISSDTVQVNGRLLKKHEAKQREALVARVKEKSFDQVMEEAAYTWFNRIIAIRFMEVNGYLPTGVRVLSSTEPGQAVPDIITNALHLDLDMDLNLVHAYLDKHDDDELFRYLFTRQCNKLNEILPGLFEKIEDYTELLLPNNLLIEGSVIRRLVSDIPEGDFQDQVEIIGWLYQYYISEKKDQVFAALKKNVKITKENIPAATQLFTPAWIVKYMVENSLGRLWLEHDRAESGLSNEYMNASYYGWKYYIEEAEQEPEVQKQLDEIREKRKTIRLEEIKVLDPCMGSGHILVYAFDVLFDIYQSAGYTQRDAVRLIVEKNLYGLDIDDRAYQLAYFAVMMKARKHDRRFFTRGITPNLCAIQESNSLVSFEHGAGQLNLDDLHRETANYLIKAFRDAKEYGSILNIETRDYDGLLSYIEQLQQNGADDLMMSMWLNNIAQVMPALIKQAKIMAQKYDVVVTNPPYMGSGGMNAKLSKYVKEYYPDVKSDLSTVFMMKTIEMCKASGNMSMINIPVWMFLSSYEKLRVYIIAKNTIVNMLHFGRGVFGSDFGTTAFVINKSLIGSYTAVYRKLFLKHGAVDSLEEKESMFFDNTGYFTMQQGKFTKIPGMPVAYWVSEKLFKAFAECQSLKDIARARSGAKTGKNELFVRNWWEVNFNNMSIDTADYNSCVNRGLKWFPYNKGGDYRNWYGNRELIVDFQFGGKNIKTYGDIHGRSYDLNAKDVYFHQGITWTALTISKNSFRFSPAGSVFDSNKGPMIFSDDSETLYYLLAFFISPVAQFILKVLNPSLSLQNGDMDKLPIIIDESHETEIVSLSKNNVDISCSNWNSFEISWDYKCHPFISMLKNFDNVINKPRHLKYCFDAWKLLTESQFFGSKANEEKLNQLFIKIYDIQDELTSEVAEKDVTIRKADLGRDIRSLISYAIGCMFGRYSLDVDGLAYAGGIWYESKYKTFIPDNDNVLPILDDEYFDDDIVARFIQFLRVTFSEETLEENLDFTADALGRRSSETSRQTIRRYFLKDFFKDHVKIYQKRPIYWLFDSGKEDGFKALIYMHRYDEFTVARVRTDYLHRLQRAYEAEARRLEVLIDSDVSPREKTAARKKRERLQKQMQECLAYDQVIAHVANQRLKIDLDDGVKVNYAKFQGIEVPQGDGKKPLKANLLAKI